MRGIDVSYVQGAVDWRRVARDGIKFAFVKASQGKLVNNAASGPFTDPRFMANVKGASVCGLDVGVYHYLCAGSADEAEREAEYFIAATKPVRSRITLWYAIDAEEKKYLPPEKNALTETVLRFAEVLRSEGLRPMLYTNPDFLTYKLGDVSSLPLWLAWWGVGEDRAMQYHPTVWQYGDTSVGGMKRVDGDLGYYAAPPAKIQRGDRVRVVSPVIYNTSLRFAVYYDAYDVLAVDGRRAVIGVGGVVTAAVDVKNLQRIGG